MKHVFEKAGSLLLMFCLLCSLLPAAAFADDGYSMSVSGSVDEYMEWTWQTPDSEPIILHFEESWDYPAGISVEQAGLDCLQITGTPKTAGTYQITSHVTTISGLHDVVFTITITAGDKAETTYTASLQGKVGTAVSWSWATQDGENIGDVYVEENSLPAGLYIPTPGSNTFQITGTPTAAGTGNCTILVETFDNIYHVELSYTIASADEKFEVTKSPTSESVSEGGSAMFIASATNYSYVDWILSSGGATIGTYRSETYTSVNGATLSAYKDDDGREVLVLKNIPSAMNGYTIMARFTNTEKGSTVQTQSCSLTVKAENLKTPVISTQPSASTKTVGEATVLTVAASDPNSGTLNYQWYSNTSASTTGGTIINGANQPSYTPPQTVGTTYYYCKITSSRDGKTSTAVTTAPVAVTYQSAVASPSPSPSVSPSASSDPNASPAASSSTSAGGSQRKGNSTGLLILLIVLILLSAAALIALVLYTRREEAANLEEAISSRLVMFQKWECPNCGTKNRAGNRFCSNCGAANPKQKYE